MKTLSAFAGSFAAMANANQLLEISDKAESIANRFGNIETKIVHDLENFVFEKEIKLGGDSNHYFFDYDQQTKHL